MMRIQSNRAYAVDALRGFAVCLMVVYHALYDLRYIYGLDIPFFPSLFTDLMQQAIGMMFSVVVGISLHLTRAPWRHAWKLSLAALAVSIVTALFMPTERITFGVLHMLACSVWLIILFERIMLKIPASVGCMASGIGFLVTQPEPLAWLVHALRWNEHVLYRPWSFLYGFPDAMFMSADYYPLVPWCFVVLFGYFYYRWRPPQTAARFTGRALTRGLVWTGQHALVLYFIHQPVLLGLLRFL